MWRGPRRVGAALAACNCKEKEGQTAWQEAALLLAHLHKSPLQSNVICQNQAASALGVRRWALALSLFAQSAVNSLQKNQVSCTAIITTAPPCEWQAPLLCVSQLAASNLETSLITRPLVLPWQPMIVSKLPCLFKAGASFAGFAFAGWPARIKATQP